MRSHLDKLPYLLVSLAITVLTVAAQTPGTVGGRTVYPPDFLQVFPLTMIPVMMHYVLMVIWPDPSQYSIIYTVHWSRSIDGRFFMAFAVVLLLAMAAVWLYRKAPRLMFWYALIFLGLLPVLQIIPLVTKMNDRYLYFPMIGVAGLCACGVSALQARIRPGMLWVSVISIFTASIVFLTAAGYQRSIVWRSTVTLFSDAAAKAPDQYAPWAGLAAGYRHAGELESALHYYGIASRFGYLDAEDALAIAGIYLERGEPEKAYSYIWNGILKDATGRGLLLLGRYNSMTGNLDDAEKQLLNYLEMHGDSAEGLVALGKVYLQKNLLHKAQAAAQRAMEVDGDSPQPYIVAACVMAAEGNQPKSLQMLQEAVQRGFTDWQSLDGLDCLAVVRRDSRFSQLMQENKP